MSDEQDESIKGLSFYPKYPGDYARKTRHLTMLEHGAYNLLLDAYFSLGGPLSSNASGKATAKPSLMPDPTRLYRLCGAISKSEQDAVDFVLSEFFEEIDGVYKNKRADETLIKQRELYERRSAAGRKGAKAKYSKKNGSASSKASGKAKAKPVAKAKHPEPKPEPIKKIYKKEFFEEFFKVYPRPIDPSESEDAFKDAIERGADPEVIISAARAYASEQEGNAKKYIKAPATFLDKEVYLSPEYNKPKPKPVDTSMFVQWQKDLAKIIGVAAVNSWFIEPTLDETDEKQETMIVYKKFCYEWIKNNYSQTLEGIGIKKIILSDEKS